MSTILKLASGTEFPLASAPNISGGVASFQVTRSDTVTAESLYAAVKDFLSTKSFRIVTDGTAGTTYSNYELSGMVGIDGGNIVFTMRQKSDLEIQVAALGAQLVQAQLEIFKLKGGAS
jgi:hypothetical protein